MRLKMSRPPADGGFVNAPVQTQGVQPDEDVAQAGQMLSSILQAAVQGRCSDVHLRAGRPAYGRVDGKLIAMQGQIVSAAEIEGMIRATCNRQLPTGVAEAFEFSFEHVGVSRFRGHAFRENGTWALCLRAIPLNVPTFKELRLPASMKQVAQTSPGLVLICGPTGSGKSTTAASMLQFVADQGLSHVLTIEDPVEFRIEPKTSCVSQREVGRDTPDYPTGLRSAMREDPDVLFLGEIRDRESLEVAMSAAETGHAVYSTFHTHSVLQTIGRLVGLFETGQQPLARERLAECLRGILSQRLLPMSNSRGRVLATEMLINNYATKECIRDAGRLKTIVQVLERSNDQSMHSFDQSLIQLVQARAVDAQSALAYASSPSNLRRALSLSGVAA